MSTRRAVADGERLWVDAHQKGRQIYLALGTMLVLGFGEAARAREPLRLDPGAALRSLGGLGGALEAEGWTLSTLRGSTVSPGDIVDPTDNQVIVSGADCFDQSVVRTGQGVSADLHKALKLGAHGGPVGFKGSLKGSASLDVGIASAEIAEIPLASLLPSPTCTASLQRLAQQGYPVASFRVVQSVLWADLGLSNCLGANAEVRAPGGAGELSAESCRNLSGTRVAIGIRTANVVTALGLKGLSAGVTSTWIDQGGLQGPTKVSTAPKKSKKKGPPCWISGACHPYLAESHLIGVGQAANPGMADQTAKAVLLEPFEVRYRALLAGMPANTTKQVDVGAHRAALGTEARVVERYNDGTRFFSLAVIERAPAIERRRMDLAAVSPAPAESSQPLVNLRATCGSLPQAREQALVHAELGVLTGVVSRPPKSINALVEECEMARLGLRLAPPANGYGEHLGVLASAQGFTVLGEGDPSSNVTVSTKFDHHQSEISGMVQVTVEGQVTLLSQGSPPIVLRVSTGNASKDADKALRGALRQAQSDLAVQTIEVLLGGAQ